MINHKINRNKKGNILSNSLITPTPVGCGHHKVCFLYFSMSLVSIFHQTSLNDSKLVILNRQFKNCSVQTLVLLSFDECPGRNYILKGECETLTKTGELTFFLGHYTCKNYVALMRSSLIHKQTIFTLFIVHLNYIDE